MYSRTSGIAYALLLDVENELQNANNVDSYVVV